MISDGSIYSRHHPHGREGDNIFKWFLVHNECHDWIHENTQEARERQLID